MATFYFVPVCERQTMSSRTEVRMRQAGRVLRGIHTARRTAPRSSASNSEIETGAIRAAKAPPYGAVRRVAALIMHDVQRRAAPYCAVRRRWSADRNCFAAPYGTQCECPFKITIH